MARRERSILFQACKLNTDRTGTQVQHGTYRESGELLSKRVKKSRTVQGLLGFNRDRTGIVDRDRGKTCGKKKQGSK